MKQLGPRELGKPCPLCGQKVEASDWDGASARLWCSEFCSDTTDEEKAAYVAMDAKEQTWGYWPCSYCGDIVEDAFTEEFSGKHTSSTICAGCGDKVRLHYRTELLKEIAAAPVLTQSLRAKIAVELKS